MDNKEKVLLITGASSDVGIELLSNVYRSYGHIYLQYRNMNDRLERLIKEMESDVNLELLQCDFELQEDVSNMISGIMGSGKIPNNIIHLPAPKPRNDHFHKKSIADFEQGWLVSVQSIIRILQAFLPYMSKQHYGRVMFMLSSCTVGISPKFQSDYVTTKYTLLGLMKALSAEYGEKGITINGVSPDMMDTKFLSEYPHLIVESYAEKKMTGRNITVEEILPVMEYILSDESASMTGQNICIGEG